MCRAVKALCISVASICLLSGCIKSKTVDEVQEPPVSTQLNEYSMGNWGVSSFSSFNGYDNSDTELFLYPYFDIDAYILLKRIDLSGQPLLEHINTCIPDCEVQYYKNDIAIISDGFTTYGYRLFGTTAILASTYNVPKGYVKLALNNVWLDL